VFECGEGSGDSFRLCSNRRSDRVRRRVGRPAFVSAWTCPKQTVIGARTIPCAGLPVVTSGAAPDHFVAPLIARHDEGSEVAAAETKGAEPHHNFAIFAAIRRASSLVSNLAADRHRWSAGTAKRPAPRLFYCYPVLMPGLCPTCIHCKEMHNDRRNTFLLCLLSKSDPRYPKYPRLPVLSCEGYRKQPCPNGTTATEPSSKS
jgi:hypothetical protein